MQLKQVGVVFGHPPLLDNIDLTINQRERLCIVGRNGCGKSTLMKVIAGEILPDDGQRIIQNDLVIGTLPQDPPQADGMSIYDFVAKGLPEGELLHQYFVATQRMAANPDEKAIAELTAIQQKLEHHNAWQAEQKVSQVLTQLHLAPELMLTGLSGGQRRKAALAKALVASPDILLLDEPTNHLDIQMIRYLEDSLLNFTGALVFISHDRAFIRRLATRIVDLDRGRLTSYECDYPTYLARKAKDLETEAQQNALFDKKLSQEESWIRQGIKARRTRNEGRVRALKALRREYADRRKVQGVSKISHNEAQRSGKVVAEAVGLNYAIGELTLVKQTDFLLNRGDKVALIGPNGAGKTTFINLLLGKLPADSGKLKLGVNLEVAYFDQHREQLELNKPVIDVVADGKRDIVVNGANRHVISYLQDFLFTPERVMAPVSSLSGGEKNRLLLAKLLLKPSNVLVLDEPTNDLDIETLELLEEWLSDYQGTLLLVSHDREFVDNIVTRSLYFAGNGQIEEFVGGYGDIEAWLSQKKIPKQKETNTKPQSPRQEPSSSKPKKLSYKLQLELDQLPGKIEDLEQQVEDLQARVNAPDFFTREPTQTSPILEQLANAQCALDDAYSRWDELDGMQQ